MNMDGTQKLAALISILVFLLIMSIIGITCWRSQESMLSQERLIKSGFSPAIFTCINNQISWKEMATYNICSQILTANHLSKEQAQDLIKGLNK